MVIPAYLDARDAALKPFRWTKAADNILSLITRFCHQPSTSNLALQLHFSDQMCFPG